MSVSAVILVVSSTDVSELKVKILPRVAINISKQSCNFLPLKQ